MAAQEKRFEKKLFIIFFKEDLMKINMILRKNYIKNSDNESSLIYLSVLGLSKKITA